ncbi:MAG: MBL fold metallo-hydrolase [Candidatus Coprovivens sp.]
MNIKINTHSSIKLITNKNIYIDPYKINENTNDADYIFITHEHYDHYDLDSINKIKKNNTKLIVPNSMINKVFGKYNIDNVIGVDPKETYQIDDLIFETIRSYNIEKTFHPKEKNWVGYIFNIENKKIYIAGDTDITDDNKNIKCDIALLPIGGTYTMNSKEAAILTNIINPSIVIPIHYGTVAGSYKDEEIFIQEVNNNIEVKLLMEKEK